MPLSERAQLSNKQLTHTVCPESGAVSHEASDEKGCQGEPQGSSTAHSKGPRPELLQQDNCGQSEPIEWSKVALPRKGL